MCEINWKPPIELHDRYVKPDAWETLIERTEKYIDSVPCGGVVSVELARELLERAKESRHLKHIGEEKYSILLAKTEDILKEMQELGEEAARLRAENKKIRGALIRWCAIADYGGFEEGQDYEAGFEKLVATGQDPDPSMAVTWGQKEFLDSAEGMLRMRGVIK